MNSQAPLKWFNKFGGAGLDIGYGVKETFKRQYIICGSTTSFGYGSTDAYLILIDSMGQKVWEKSFGGALTDVAKKIVVNPIDSGYIFVGYTNSLGSGGYDLYIVRTDKNGSLIWQKSFGGLDWDFGNDLAIGPDGNVYVCGSTYSMGYGNKDAYLLKINSTNGIPIWQKTFGGNLDDEFKSLKITNTNSLIIAGQTKSYNDNFGDILFFKLSLNGDSIFSKTYGLKNKEDYANSIIENFASTGYVLSGGTESYSTFGKDAFIFGIDALGDSTWLVNYGNANLDQESIKVLPASNNTGTYVISYSDVENSFFKRNPKNLILNSVGVYYTGHDFGDTEDEEFYDLENTSDNGFIGVGYTYSFGSNISDVFVVKYDSLVIEGSNLIGVRENEKILNRNVEVYPTHLSNGINSIYIASEKPINVKVIDLFGRTVNFTIEKLSSSYVVNLNQSNNGVYFLILAIDNEIHRYKILKE